MAAPQFVISFITAGSIQDAEKIARVLVDERLAACCNIVNPVTSIYRWKGVVCEDPEALIIAKSRKSMVKALIKRVVELHPYEVPEVISMPIENGNPPYLKWLLESTGAARKKQGVNR